MVIANDGLIEKINIINSDNNAEEKVEAITWIIDNFCKRGDKTLSLDLPQKNYNKLSYDEKCLFHSERKECTVFKLLDRNCCIKELQKEYLDTPEYIEEYDR